MRPNYDITHTILRLSSTISSNLGEAKSSTLSKPTPLLRQENEIKAIFATLHLDNCLVENNHLNYLLNQKKPSGDKEIILQAFNAVKAYRQLRRFEGLSKSSFLLAHKTFMNGIDERPGKLRIKGVIHERGSTATHLSPPPHLVGFLMDELFGFLEKSNEIPLIKACLSFYELLTIEPFSSGNGRVGRFWWKVLLQNEYPVFEYIPLEELIFKNHDDLIQAMAKSGRLGKPTPFLEFVLFLIDEGIQSFFKHNEEIKTAEQRLEYFVSDSQNDFSRKDYMVTFENISTATASRDLKMGVEKGILKKEGDKRKTIYRAQRKIQNLRFSS